MAGGTVSIAVIESYHGELMAGLENLSHKAAAIRLMAYLRGLPPVETHPYTLYYRAEALTELCARLLAPIPLTSHLGLLEEVIGVLQEELHTPVALHVSGLQPGVERLKLVHSVEHMAQAIAQGAEGPGGPGGEEPGDPWARVERLVESPEGRAVLWPLHLGDPEEISRAGAILTVLTDGEGIPGEYREGYLASLAVTVRFRGRRGGRVVRGRDGRGEEVVLGEELKGLVREALDRAVSLLGPGARDKARASEAQVDVTLLAPGPVGAVHGRSLLLPLVLAITRAVAEELNLGATARWETGIVWTGDVDDHGALRPVTGLTEKLTRVLASRCAGMVFPEPDDERLRTVFSGLSPARQVALHPIASLLDLAKGGGAGEIRHRSLGARGASMLKKASRPLGLAGTAVVTALLLAAAYAVPRLSSWLDTAPAFAFVTPDSSHIELRNSRDRTLRIVPIPHTHALWTKLADVDGDGCPEILWGTGAQNLPPATVFCMDRTGRELWRFRGGFQNDEQAPYPLENRFSVSGVAVHDFDRDGRVEILACLRHSPRYAGQLALLRPDGRHVSSFWHRGYFSMEQSEAAREAPLFYDIDGDGFDEILIGGTNNRLNRGVLIVLDPRRISGKGYEDDEDPPDPQWQSYVVFPRLAELEDALGSPRFHAGTLDMEFVEGRPRFRVSLMGYLPAVGRTNVFNYRLTPELEVEAFYAGDPLLTWGAWALARGVIDIDVRSPEFEEHMRRIEIIPGPPELLNP